MGFDTVAKVLTCVDHEGLDMRGCHAVAAAFWASQYGLGHGLSRDFNWQVKVFSFT